MDVCTRSAVKSSHITFIYLVRYAIALKQLYSIKHVKPVSVTFTLKLDFLINQLSSVELARDKIFVFVGKKIYNFIKVIV